MIGNPFEYDSSSGTTVQPRRTPVKPANLEKDDISIATCERKIEVDQASFRGKCEENRIRTKISACLAPGIWYMEVGLPSEM